jgi:hypothetical protein
MGVDAIGDMAGAELAAGSAVWASSGAAARRALAETIAALRVKIGIERKG